MFFNVTPGYKLSKRSLDWTVGIVGETLDRYGNRLVVKRTASGYYVARIFPSGTPSAEYKAVGSRGSGHGYSRLDDAIVSATTIGFHERFAVLEMSVAQRVAAIIMADLGEPYEPRWTDEQIRVKSMGADLRERRRDRRRGYERGWHRSNEQGIRALRLNLRGCGLKPCVYA